MLNKYWRHIKNYCDNASVKHVIALRAIINLRIGQMRVTKTDDLQEIAGQLIEAILPESKGLPPVPECLQPSSRPDYEQKVYERLQAYGVIDSEMGANFAHVNRIIAMRISALEAGDASKAGVYLNTRLALLDAILPMPSDH